MRDSVIVMMVLANVIMVSSACKRELGNECDGSSVLLIATNAPLTAGEDLQLQLPNVRFAQSFEWKGPDGFTSTEQNPSISNVQADNSGEYSVNIRLAGGCVVTAKTEKVFVHIPTPPCTQVNNTAKIDGAVSMVFNGGKGE